ncbi:MAG: bifunctional RNase H/acid phosphatase [Streptosporangiales bacterium]|nr:bifunctional RNase H/acid phosphatase [Streptosporangiales bacterium]
MTRLVVEADGGSRGNPGPAGYGAVVKDADTGAVLAEVAESIGKATNNVAEYSGLVAGLRAAHEVDPAAEVEVRMDSKLVVEQMRGTWQVKHPDLRPLAAQAAGLARSLGSVSYDWIPRARNSHADRLANEAMDAATGRSPRTRRRQAVDADEDDEPRRRRSFVPSNLGTPTRTLLARHGATAASLDGWFNGAADEPLADAGRDQAAALARALAAGPPVDAIVSSPLRRARETADVVGAALGIAVREEKDLREVDFGAWEGLSLTEIAERYAHELEQWTSDPAAAPPDGESIVAVHRRATRARDKLLARFPGQTVLVVAHGMLLAVLVAVALDVPAEAAFRMRLETTGLSGVDWYPEGFARLTLFNDTAHLQLMP